ncbi:SPOSA6832_00639 [Sporobolomyces salmonicolor]|uniref:SPOSA6832_00639-mRNA-1:cds n=1 Tax=Sporidiobolus salmonicolor TaxID=5005 RepID=A0A0D6EH94_SPOSA|nr:SPOSA6832_00639 [Sporobolomyces salmonicolor]
MAPSATSAVPPSAVFLPPHYGRPGRPSSPDVFGRCVYEVNLLSTLLRPVIQSLSRPGSPSQPRSSPSTQPSALPGPSAPLSATHADAPTLFVDPPSPERSHTSLPAQFPPREPTDPAPTVESQGFVLYIGSLVAYVVFLVWAFVPEEWLEWTGVEWYPMRRVLLFARVAEAEEN